MADWLQALTSFMSMDRHDPLGDLAPASGTAPEPAEPPPKRSGKALPKASRKAPRLLRELAEVKDETLAFLYGGADQQPGDYDRNLDRVAAIRQEFTAFCETNPHFANWRQAWTAFLADRAPRLEDPRPASLQAPAIPQPVIPLWRQRLAHRRYGR